MKSKKCIAALLGLMLTVLGTGIAWADSDTTNDRASLTFSLTPNVDFGVSIDTGNITMDFGSVALGTLQQRVRPATVTILGTITSDGSQTTGQELDLALTFVGGWSLDTSPSIDTTSNETDAIAVYALFSDTSLSLAPTPAQFDAESGGFTQTNERAGGGSGDGTRFEKQGGGALPGDGMDHMSTGDAAHLWMLFRLPADTTTGNQQEITLTATAVNAS